jgi:hypothetical protein
MSLHDNVKDVVAQYASGVAPDGDPGVHFQQVAQSVDKGTRADGIAAALRSNETPPFPQLVAQLFSSGSNDQKATMLNTLLGSMTPQQRAQLAPSVAELGSAASVTKGQAASVPPTVVQALAQGAERHQPGVVEKMSALYAAHPTLVKTLGTTALMVAMRKIGERQLTGR